MNKQQIELLIEKLQPYGAKLWEKHGLSRIYMTGGYIEIKDGEINTKTLKANLSAKTVDLDAVAKIVESVQGQPTSVPGVYRLSPAMAEAVASTPNRDNRDDTAKALDAMYGRGNWDKWDREDYEG